ncbi:Amino acid transport protein (plasmid) [Lactobacillus plantarum subsp. plantarum P-8] [Lactiplantibacillus plantarum]|uniref:Amino acid permease n=1 Tax=Lactiplantibacillus plantarum CMPG5300 TaxID=1304889 RepID=A0AAW3FJJ4_LACPN|nr:amino acid permease [Lactiplantibacillus plantarum]KGH41128.1 Amino acid permease [Lactiplantibacillus plantarum CMPG5300]VTU69638.1 Amino acid transport protein (plasmid) [Lactobacillus plantarum subsp. plantarum P-8] [Lactiplantibacillus plantarum]
MKPKIVKNQDGTMRSLSNRHVQMIAIGGTIGTGLFLGSGSTISKTGPSVMLVYLILGLFFFFMMRAIGEMFYADPTQHTFVSFISRYLGPTIGHFTGWTYWIGLVFVCMAELTATATYVQYWLPSVPAWIIELVFLGILVSVNLIAARLFGEAEFWFAMILTGVFMLINHSVTPLGHVSLTNISHDYTLFPHGIFNFIAAFPMVFFAFQGIEFVSITIGEAKSPHTVIKKAVNETLLRILLFYIGALVVIMIIIPWTSLSANSSPFVQVFKLAGFPAAAATINFVVLTSAAIAFTASLVLITPIMSLTTAISSVFTIVTGVSSDMYIIVYTLTLVAHRRYRASTDFLPNGFIMPWYKITSPLTILFFGIIFISLFFIPEDIVGAVGAICWTLIFGGIEFLRQGKTNLNNTN